MAKFPKINKLTKEEQDQLMIEFCQALCQIKKPEEAANFIIDLLSKSEAQMLAKRLKIARCLIRGETYQVIKENLKVSYGTIARVNEWLKMSGEGYRLVIERTKDIKSVSTKPRWSGLKRKYPAYFWPEIVLKEIVHSANVKQKEKLERVLRKMDEKTGLYQELNQLLRQSRKSS